jgi:hypothetical protein
MLSYFTIPRESQYKSQALNLSSDHLGDKKGPNLAPVFRPRSEHQTNEIQLVLGDPHDG